MRRLATLQERSPFQLIDVAKRDRVDSADLSVGFSAVKPLGLPDVLYFKGQSFILAKLRSSFGGRANKVVLYLHASRSGLDVKDPPFLDVEDLDQLLMKPPRGRTRNYRY